MNEFTKLIDEGIEEFRRIPKAEVIRIVGHFDADGICASSILIRALENEGFSYSLSIVPQLTESNIIEFFKEGNNTFFFVDLGTGQFPIIRKYLKQKKVFILDHHSLADQKSDDNIVHINPHLVGIDGSSEVSGSGVTYLFCKALNDKNVDQAYLAVVGATGDIQEREDGFFSLNKEILDTAVNNNKIEVIRSPKWFGITSRPIFKLLAYSADIYIPGITGSESKAIQFMRDLSIEPKIKSAWKIMDDLTDEEKQRLLSSIILRRTGEDNPEDIFGKSYILLDEEPPFKDAKEFSTILNACGRMGKPSLGVGACLNDRLLKKKAVACLEEYRKELVKAIRWYEDNKNKEDVIISSNLLLLNAKNSIMYTVAGTLASILSNSAEITSGTHILTLAYCDSSTIKASIRIAGKNKEVHLKDTLFGITKELSNCQIGGHKNAAGAYIPRELEKEFITSAVNYFKS
jgi:single-stranded-DNA-specific exonuclease